jgi:YVTN family beta-propeller protein
LAAVAAVVFLATRDAPAGLAGVEPNHIAVIDPAANNVVAAIPVGLRPGPVAAGGGSVWVGNLVDRNLMRVDTARKAPAGVVDLDDRTPTALAVEPGSVWVLHGRSGELSHVDPQFMTATDIVRITQRPPAGSTGGVATGGGRLWAAYPNATLARVNRGTMRPAGTVVTRELPAAVIVARRDVWVANSGSARVQRFDPTTFEQGELDAFPVGNRPSGLAIASGVLWVANRGDDSVTGIDLTTGAISTVPVGEEPSAIAAGAGSVWVANSGDGTVSRIDADRGKVVATVDIRSAPAGIVVADGLVWVSAQEL